MTNPGQTALLTAYMHERVWDAHLPGGGYDVDRLAQRTQAHFGLPDADLPILGALAGQVVGTHCPHCGATVQADGRECFCCGWSRP